MTPPAALDVRLRPTGPEDVAVLDRPWRNPQDAGPFGWYGFRDGSLAERIRAGRTLTEDGGVLAVEEGGALVGDVSWISRDNAPPPAGRCWMIGAWLVPEARGRGIGTAAQRLLVSYLFSTTTLERIEAGTELDNRAEQAALERVGFTREGVLRHAAYRAGGYRDMVLYSILRAET